MESYDPENAQEQLNTADVLEEDSGLSLSQLEMSSIAVIDEYNDNSVALSQSNKVKVDRRH